MEISLSYSALNNIVEGELKRNPNKYKNKKKTKMPLFLSHGREKTNEELFEKLKYLGLAIKHDLLKELYNNFLSAEELAKWLIKEHKLVFTDDSDSDWLWICLAVLWERLFPDIPHFELIDTKMQLGYNKIENNENIEGLRLWSEVWSDIMLIVEKDSLETVYDFDSSFRGTQSLFNWFQDYDMELQNKGIDDTAYFRQRIIANEAFLNIFYEIDDNLYENTCRAVAESYFELGNQEKADSLFEQWLKEDPAWGWGWIGWSDCYYMGRGKEKNYNRAVEILLKGLEDNDLRDKEFLLDRLESLYEELAEKEKLEEIRKQINDYKESIQQDGGKSTGQEKFDEDTPCLNNTNRSSYKKVGRNDSCPCGSGKKYKKCCLNKEIF